MSFAAALFQFLAVLASISVIGLVWTCLPSLSSPWNDFDMPSPPLSIGSCNSCGGASALPTYEIAADGTAVTMSARVATTIMGALVADSFSLGTHQSYDIAAIREASIGVDRNDLRAVLGSRFQRRGASRQQSDCGDELLHSLSVISARGFNFKTFTVAWRDWGENYEGELSVGAREALRNLASGMPGNTSGTHFIDLMGAVRAPALLLLAEYVDDNALALASREIQAVSHENPMALQAGDFLMRAALRLLRGQLHPKTPEKRRKAVAQALHAAADAAGSQFHAVIDEAFTEAQSRDAWLHVMASKEGSGSLRDVSENVDNDMQVLGRLTASGDQLGQEVQGGKTSYIIPAIIWFALAYDTFSEAVVASTLLGGESAVRGIFLGLLLAARDGPGSIPQEWLEQLNVKPELQVKVPKFIMPFYLCKVPGSCHVGEGWKGERSMHNVDIAAVVLPLQPHGSLYSYRIFVRIDGSKLLKRHSKPNDWDDVEDGPWEPPDDGVESGQANCLARYFQFTTSSGRHAPFGEWPARALCRLTLGAPIAYESFDLVLPERLKDFIGGAVIGNRGNIVKLPALAVKRNAKAPEWETLCERVGTLRIPEGKWQLDEDSNL